jgi:hypothetical protein
MSQAIEIKYTFKNGKTRVIGAYNPKNDRLFNKEEKSHLFNMYRAYILPKVIKFNPLVSVKKYNEGINLQ